LAGRRLLRRGWQHPTWSGCCNDLETQLEPIFVYFKQCQPGKGSFAIALVSSRIREFAAKYESQTAAAAEITDDSDGLVEAIADSTTTEITDDSNGREVAIANTTTAAIKDVAGSAFGMEFMNGSRKPLPTRQATRWLTRQ